MDAVPPGLNLRDEDQWLVQGLDNTLEHPSFTPDNMRARAEELRAEAGRAEGSAARDTYLALAARYEHAAASRAAAL